LIVEYSSILIIPFFLCFLFAKNATKDIKILLLGVGQKKPKKWVKKNQKKQLVLVLATLLLLMG
jgi:hypothetical protein